MAEDVVLARFTADLAELQKDFDKYLKSLEKVEDKQDDVADSSKDLASTQAAASKKRTDALKKEEAELKRLTIEQKKAFDPAVIRKYNDQISESKKRISLLKGETQQFGSLAKSALAGVGAGLLAAFSVGAVSAFAKSSIEAFIEAEENANRLKFAITQVAGESEVAFNKLIRQSEELSKISIFSDDDIQRSQTALAQFGLTSQQIDRLIPKILDLASANKIDLATATDASIRAFEGQTRGLIDLGIKFDDTGSRIGNYNKLIEESGKFTGATAEATETLSGELKVLENRADELQESIGSGLAPLFVKLKVGVFEATKAVIDFIAAGADLNKFRFTRSLEGQKTAFDEVKEKVESLTDANIKAGQSTEEASGNALKAISNEIEARLRLRDETLKGLTFQISKDEELLKLDRMKAQNRVNAVKNEKKAIDELLEASQKEVEQQSRLLTASQLRTKSVEELNSLLISNGKLNDIISKDNVELINKELAARLKANEKAAQEAEKTLAALKAKFGKFEFILPIELESLTEDVNKKIEAVNDKFIPLELKSKPLVLPPAEPGNLIDSIFKANEQIIGLSQQLVNELSVLYGSLVERQIEGIEKTKQAQLDSISLQLEANGEALEKRRISATESERIEKKLLDEQVKAEKEADKKIREIKRKQFDVDKAAALIQITIDTARAVAEALPAIPVSILMGVLGAAQAAIVLTKVNPYKKGTTDSHKGWAQVDEAGKEMIIRPKDNRGRITYMEKGTKVVPAKETKQYSGLFDAIIEGKGEDYLFKNYLTPALLKQKEDFQKQEQASFANNISKSIVYNSVQGGKGDWLLERLTRKTPTAEDIGIAVARHIPQQDIYRR